MKVVHINKLDAGGGAAVAAMRIHKTLLRAGVDSHFLAQNVTRNEQNEHSVGRGIFHKIKSFSDFIGERLTILPHEKEAAFRYNFSIANTGSNIASSPVLQDADVINLHWINQGFLSLDGLADIFALGKPVVWTLHDMWPFTGGCHYAGGCLEFNERCGWCPFMRTPSKNDLSALTFQRKKEIYSHANLSVVTCSRWLGSLAKSGSLFRNVTVTTIPNPIDMECYNTLDRAQCRRDLNLPEDKKLILFGAANLLDIRKGFRYLEEALGILNDNFKHLSQSIELVTFGKIDKAAAQRFAFKTHAMEFISNQQMLVKLYNACDCFVLPSLQDNLPNTVVESLSCGTPVVGFRIGGVPEMVEHRKTGFLAEMRNSLSLANGIYNVLFFGGETMRQAARQSAIEKYSESVVAQMYIDVYKKMLR